MVVPEAGPLLFDTSAEAWLGDPHDAVIDDWLHRYGSRHKVNVSAVTMVERVRGYSLLWQASPPHERAGIETRRLKYLARLGRVFATDSATAIAAGEIMALVPSPPSPPRRTHRLAESRQDRLARWRFDCLIAATALVARIPLIHNNPRDFEASRYTIERSPERFPSLGPLHLINCSSLL